MIMPPRMPNCCAVRQEVLFAPRFDLEFLVDGSVAFAR